MENQKDFSNTKIKRKETFDGRQYVLVQFFQIPNAAERKTMSEDGLVLSSYLPNNCYVVSLPVKFDKSKFAKYGIRSFIPFDNKIKSHFDLLDERTYPEQMEKIKGKLDVVVKCFEGVDIQNAKKLLEKKNCEVLMMNESAQSMVIRIDKDRLQKIISLPFIFYVEPIAPESTPDDTKGRSLHRSNFINSDISTGLHYDGTGVSVALSDDGVIGLHIDRKGRETINSTVNSGNHGDMTSGILMGAGNLNPTIKGMASGAYLYYFDQITDAYSHIINAVSNLNSLNTVITSTSYSQGCNEYTTDTELVDDQIHKNHPLIHIFSAGNNNGSDCGYGAGDEWGNITGGYKQGKNVIACGNLDQNGSLDASSSRGPASDGRIKPDICSNGTGQYSTDENNIYQLGGGTSAAAPGIAGVTAQLYHAYKDMNGGQNPESGLIKAAMLNTADDLGRAGPDYQFGWGRVNARRAYNLLKENRYVIDSIDQGDSITHSITVPPGTKQMKVMVYWHDYKGAASANKALVNDINISMGDTSSNIFLPLVLNPAPDAATLDSPAVAGIDNLNNAEQIIINDPFAATYTLMVKGFSIPQGPQQYFLVYEFINDNITLTYPNGGEGFAQGESQTIRWDAYGDTGKFMVEYSADSGTTWQNLSSNVSGDSRQYNWSIFSVVPPSGTAMVRISRGGISDVNDTVFSIVKIPASLSVAFACPDSIGLKWNVVTGAAQYEIYQLGSKYMDAVGIADTTIFTITGAINPYSENWLSVASVLPNGMRGRRANAISYSAGIKNCSLSKDASLNLESPLSGTYRICSSSDSIPVAVKIKNFGLTAISNFPISYRLNNGSVVTNNISSTINPGDSLAYTFSSFINLGIAGNYTFKSWITLNGDLNIYNDSSFSSISVMSGGVSSLPLLQDFQSTTFPPTSWLLENPDGADKWTLNQTATGSGGLITKSASMLNFYYNTAGEEDALVTNVIDISSVANPELAFDVAYAQYTTSSNDGLRVEISTDCGQSFQLTGYSKTGSALSTATATTSSFVPNSASKWRNEKIDLSSFISKEAILKFVAMNDFGNNLYIDNINIRQKTVGINEPFNHTSSVSVFPNVNDGSFKIVFEKNSFLPAKIKVADAQGKIVFEDNETISGKKTIDIHLPVVAKGIYFLQINTGLENFREKIIIQ